MDLHERIDALADRLARGGELTDPAWRDALHAVPRHLFVPPVALAVPDEGPEYAVDRDRAPGAWWDAIYADQAIVTQLDDGATDVGAGRGDYSSSVSAAGVAVEFLELLAPYDGDRVLEIGTGSGWTAALLSHRLGERNVTSVEIDEGLHLRAAANLERAGYAPRLVLGDGTRGLPEGAPYDRVHVAAGVREVPYAWVAQTRPGGVIVFPWMPDFEPGHKVRLMVDDTGVATGRFSGSAGYMMLRSQRPPPAPEHQGGHRERPATLDPRRIFRSCRGLDVAVAGTLPDVHVALREGPPYEVWLWTDESGAHVTGSVVRQFGPRDLWDELEAVFFRWIRWGQPDRARFGITVSPEGQHVWLDDPDRVL
ncbi:methyltransferase domain-containing protein [Spirillospora sp. CA-294931]|uniref:methyltransferase domain-containing protein n=1 Tax=Spirillospora sp. CA-294931 TaxID=3240042 RepID=UPI003D93B735